MKVIQEGHDVVKCSIVSATIELWKYDDIILVERHRFLSEIHVDHFLDWSTKITKVLDILAVFQNSTLATQDASPHLHLRIKSHGNLFNHTTLLVTEENHLVFLSHLREEHTQSRTFHDLETDSKL